MWETIESQGLGSATYRMKVHGGWVVKVVESKDRAVAVALVFYPDPNHEWELPPKK